MRELPGDLIGGAYTVDIIKATQYLDMIKSSQDSIKEYYKEKL